MNGAPNMDDRCTRYDDPQEGHIKVECEVCDETEWVGAIREATSFVFDHKPCGEER